MSYRHMVMSKEPRTRYIHDGGASVSFDTDLRAQRLVTAICPAAGVFACHEILEAAITTCTIHRYRAWEIH